MLQLQRDIISLKDRTERVLKLFGSSHHFDTIKSSLRRTPTATGLKTTASLPSGLRPLLTNYEFRYAVELRSTELLQLFLLLTTFKVFSRQIFPRRLRSCISFVTVLTVNVVLPAYC
jgi:hypothetical protein